MYVSVQRGEQTVLDLSELYEMLVLEASKDQLQQLSPIGALTYCVRTRRHLAYDHESDFCMTGTSNHWADVHLRPPM